jgi:hypothetical protein
MFDKNFQRFDDELEHEWIVIHELIFDKVYTKLSKKIIYSY